jgi:hypothetical protein
MGLSQEIIDRMILVEKMHQSLSYVGLQYLSKMINNNVWKDCAITSNDVTNYAKYMHERSYRGCAFGKKKSDLQYSRPILYSGVGDLVCIDLLFLTTHSKMINRLTLLVATKVYFGYQIVLENLLKKQCVNVY